jgi:hypothetical protein
MLPLFVCNYHPFCLDQLHNAQQFVHPLSWEDRGLVALVDGCLCISSCLSDSVHSSVAGSEDECYSVANPIDLANGAIDLADCSPPAHNLDDKLVVFLKMGSEK